MTLLEDIKEHLINNGVDYPIYFNFENETTGANKSVILWLYDGTPNLVANNAKVQVTVKNKNMKQAEKMSDLIYFILNPIGQYKKAIEINGKQMHINALQEPFYNEKDQNDRHCFVFNVNIEYTKDRS